LFSKAEFVSMTSKGHIACEVSMSTGGFVIPMPSRLSLGLEPPYWSFKYYGILQNIILSNNIKIHMCGMPGFELTILATPHL